MKDLVPKGTGNSRFLRSSIPANITHEELVALLRAGTFPVDFAGLNADGVAVVGSAYNKANVLPDDVCNRLRIPLDSEPKDAFLSASSGGWTEHERIISSGLWHVPSGVYRIGVFAQGGGSGGDIVKVDNGLVAFGGACGFISCAIIDVTPGQEFNVIIGTGGTGGESQMGASGRASGSPGGDTLFGGDVIATGAGKLRSGYQSSQPLGYTVPSAPPEKSNNGLYMLQESDYITVTFDKMSNIFDPNMVIGSAGASAVRDRDLGLITNTPIECDLGIGGTASAKEGSTNGGNATGNGCGGGGAVTTNAYNTIRGGNGSPGIVIIYV